MKDPIDTSKGSFLNARYVHTQVRIACMHVFWIYLHFSCDIMIRVLYM